MKEWLRGAKLHPGWFTAVALCVLCWGAADGRWYGIAIGIAWFAPVILTCRSVAKANPVVED